MQTPSTKRSGPSGRCARLSPFSRYGHTEATTDAIVQADAIVGGAAAVWCCTSLLCPGHCHITWSLLQAKKDATELQEKSKSMKAEIVRAEEAAKEAEAVRDKALMGIGNLVHDSVPVDNDEVQFCSPSTAQCSQCPGVAGKNVTPSHLTDHSLNPPKMACCGSRVIGCVAYERFSSAFG